METILIPVKVSAHAYWCRPTSHPRVSISSYIKSVGNPPSLERTCESSMRIFPMFYTGFLLTFASGGQKWHIQCWQPTQKTCLNANIIKNYINRMPVPLRWKPFTEKTRMPHSLVNRWDFPLYLDALVLDNWIGGIFNKIWWSLHRLQISKYTYIHIHEWNVCYSCRASYWFAN